MIALTGGAGFIGSCMLKKLNDNGIYDIVVVDRLGSGEKWKNLAGKRFNDFVHKDVFRERIQEGWYKDSIEAIFHFGACSDTTEKDADYLIDNNFSYSRELAEYALKYKTRFIYASSAATYGDGSMGYGDNSFYDLYPMNCYGLSKQIFDIWVLDNGYDKVFTGIKFFNVFGPNEYHKGEMASMVYKSFLQIQKTGRVKLFRSNDEAYPDGGQKRDFIYVKDAVDVVWNMYKDKGFAGIYNLGTGLARTWNDLANAVFAAMNTDPVIEYIEMPEALAGQYQNYTKAEMVKLGRTNVPAEFQSLEDAVKDYVGSYLMMQRYL